MYAYSTMFASIRTTPGGSIRWGPPPDRMPARASPRNARHRQDGL